MCQPSLNDNEPVIEFGSTEEVCAALPRSQALFGAGATPTSIVASPFEPDVILVALWNRAEVVSVRIGDDPPAEPAPFLTGFGSPQHLLSIGPELLLVTDHATGDILSVRPVAG